MWQGSLNNIGINYGLKVNKDDCIVLNISGGGVKRLQKEKGTIVVEPWLKGPRENLADLVISSLQS